MLRARLRAGLQRFLSDSQEFEFADRPLAVSVYQQFDQLLARAIAPEHWATVQAAALYLLDPDDDDNDMLPLGMEDDAEVFNDVCDWLGYPELKVAH